jgi:polar amino acid transport system permease protein
MYGQHRTGAFVTIAPEQMKSIDVVIPREAGWKNFPYWLMAILAFVFFMAGVIIIDENYREAFDFIVQGLGLTLYATALAFVLSMAIGLAAAIARMSNSVLARNIATTYIEFIRGVPMLVLLVTFGIVLVPSVLELVGIDRRLVDLTHRGIIGLATVYGAFLAEVFRAGIESIPRGQTEAALSLGLTKGQAFRKVVIPQAVRNILPALGNDFIALLKDSALLSILAIREMAQMAKIYTGSSFRFDEGYLVLTFMYLSLTLVLSLVVQWYGRRIGTVSAR